LKTNTLKELKLYSNLPETLEDCTYESTIVNTLNNEEYKIVGLTFNNALIIEGEKTKCVFKLCLLAIQRKNSLDASRKGRYLERIVATFVVRRPASTTHRAINRVQNIAKALSPQFRRYMDRPSGRGNILPPA